MSFADTVQSNFNERAQYLAFYVVIVSFACLLCGPFFTIGAMYGLRRVRASQSLLSYVYLALSSLPSLGFLAAFMPVFKDNVTVVSFGTVVTTVNAFYPTLQTQAIGVSMGNIVVALITLWLISIPLSPLGALIHELLRLFRPRTVAEMHEDYSNALSRASKNASERSAEMSTSVTGQNTYLLLGVKQRGTFPSWTKIHTTGNAIWFEEALFDQHMLIVGSSGAGKTDTIRRIVYEAAQKTERDIFFIDGKGDEELALQVRAILHKFGRGAVPIFRLGHEKPGAIYNGFSGDADALLSRLGVMMGVKVTGEGRDYYADLKRNVMEFVVRAPQGIPRSFDELEERLSYKWFDDTYGLIERMKERFATLRKERALEAVQTSMWPLINSYRDIIGPNGFTIEEVRGAIFSLRKGSSEDQSERFLQFLLEDFKDYAGKRQKRGRKALIIIDEFGVFDNENIVQLLKTARSHFLGIVLAAQTMSSVRDVRVRDEILETTITKILMNSIKPEEIAELAGTIMQLEAGMQVEDGVLTSLGTVREQHTRAINLNEVRALRPGEGFILRNAWNAKVFVSRVEEDELNELVANAEIEAIPSSTLPSPDGSGSDSSLSTPGKELDSLPGNIEDLLKEYDEDDEHSNSG